MTAVTETQTEETQTEQRPDESLAALKAAEERAAELEAQLAEARKADEERAAAEAAAQREAEAKAAAEAAKKGGSQAEAKLLEALERASKLEAQLAEFEAKEKARAEARAKEIEKKFGGLPEEVRAEIAPFKEALGDKWGELVELHAKKVNGNKENPVSVNPSIGLTSVTGKRNEVFIPDMTRRILDDYGYSDRAAKSLIVTDEEDPVNPGKSAVIFRQPLKAFREQLTPHPVIEGTPAAFNNPNVKVSSRGGGKRAGK